MIATVKAFTERPNWTELNWHGLQTDQWAGRVSPLVIGRHVHARSHVVTVTMPTVAH